MDFFDFIKSNKFIILVISIFVNVLLIISFGILLYKYLNHECICDNNKLILTTNKEDEILENNKSFYVEIKGAVKNPGVYEVTSNNIINDVVTLAGGLNKNAYTNNINMSRKVSDELVIYIFTKSEYEKSNTKTITQTVTEVIYEKCECETYDISNCTDNKQSEIISSDKDTNYENNASTSNKNENNDLTANFNGDNISKNETNLININTATKDELMKLSGVGESKANAIIEYRNTSGNFKTIEEIKNVSGIGDAMFNKIKDSITV